MLRGKTLERKLFGWLAVAAVTPALLVLAALGAVNALGGLLDGSPD